MKVMTRLGVAAIAAAATARRARHARVRGRNQATRCSSRPTTSKATRSSSTTAPPNGTLTQAGVYDTGGLGGELEGSVVDHLASQGSLAYDRSDGLLYAVNAGSNTVSVFAVFGDKLALRQVISSGGTFPVSIAVHEGIVYVLNGLEGGSVQGFAVCRRSARARSPARTARSA